MHWASGATKDTDEGYVRGSLAPLVNLRYQRQKLSGQLHRIAYMCIWVSHCSGEKSKEKHRAERRP